MSTAATIAAAPLSLSPDDVQRLLEDKSGQAVHDVSLKIAGGYTHRTLNAAESQAAEQIFRILLRETETRVRAGLAEQLKASKLVPRDIVMTMARDVEEVALPVLQHSAVLTDADLVQLVASHPDPARCIAIASREHVSEKVSDSLIATGNEQVASTLVHNGGAELSESGLSQIVTHYPENKALISAIVSRPNLTATVAERMVSLVSDSLARTLKSKYNLPEQQIAQEVEKNREAETLSIVKSARDPQEIDKLLAQLITFKRLTPSLIVSALCQGNLLFFEMALARLANVSVANARALITDRGDLGFRAIYNKSGLPSTMFPAIRLLLVIVRELESKGIRPGGPQYANRMVEEILAYSEKNPVDNVSYIIALIRRQPH